MAIQMPLEVRRSETGGIQVSWPDGVIQEITAVTLRKACPCANCREERAQPKRQSALRVIESSSAEETSLLQIRPIGGYAIGLLWADGHDTGIYSFEYLRSLTPH